MSTVTRSAGEIAEAKTVRNGIIDCDVHSRPHGADELREYLGLPWRDRFRGGGRPYYGNPQHGDRLDSIPPGGGVPGSDPDLLRAQLIDEYGVAYAVLTPSGVLVPHPDPDFCTAVAGAYNDWIADTWLSKYNHDGVFKGSIAVAHQDPAAAAAEIDRWAGHPHFIQVIMDSGAKAPFGQRQYYPIYAACERHGYPLAIHPYTDSTGVHQPSGPGYPTHYIEYHTLLSLGFQAHLVSLLTEGVFERFPGLRVCLTEGGVAWLPPLMWRLDAEWKALRSEVPWMTKAPSEYLRDHVRLTSQPLERPDKDADLLASLAAMNAHELLMFSSDYPHWDFDSPRRAFPKLPPETHERIFRLNAGEFYGLLEAR